MHVTLQPTTRVVRSLAAALIAALALTGLTIVSTPAADAAANPCPRWSVDAVVANLKADWDGDGVNNGDEVFHTSSDPCAFNASFCRQGSPYCTIKAPKPHIYFYTSHHYRPCVHGHFSADHIGADPHGDWDGDGVTNIAEIRAGTNPCHYDRYYVITYVHHAPKPPPRLPHVGGPAPASVPAPPPPVCPPGYPHHHPPTGLCYANPVNTPAGW